MSSAQLSRRSLLFVTALVASPAGWLIGCARPLASRRPEPNALLEPLMALLRNRSWARELGRAYLWRRHPRPDRYELVDYILPQARQRRLVDAPRWKLRQVVRDRVVADYARGRPTSVAGWLLSETEASLCALTVDEPQ